MNAYSYEGPFSSAYFTDESLKFREILRSLNCDRQQSYDLFSSFIELFHNISQHAAKLPSQNDAFTNSITLVHSDEKHYSLKAQNLIPRHLEQALQERLLSLNSLSNAKQRSVMGLYLLMKSSRQALTWTFTKSNYSAFKTFNLIVHC